MHPPPLRLHAPVQMLQGLQQEAAVRLAEVQSSSEAAAGRHRAQMGALQALVRQALTQGDLTILMQGAAEQTQKGCVKALARVVCGLVYMRVGCAACYVRSAAFGDGGMEVSLFGYLVPCL